MTVIGQENQLKRSSSTGCLNATQPLGYSCNGPYAQLRDRNESFSTTTTTNRLDARSPTGSDFSVQFTEQQMRLSCRRLLATLQPEQITTIRPNAANESNVALTSSVSGTCNGQCMADKVIYENAQMWIQQQQQQMIRQQQHLQQHPQPSRTRSNSCFVTSASYLNGLNQNQVSGHYQQPRVLNIGESLPSTNHEQITESAETCNCVANDVESNNSNDEPLVVDSADELQQLLSDGQLIQQAIRNLSESQRQQNSEQIRQLLLAAIQQKTLEREHLEHEEAQLQKRLSKQAQHLTNESGTNRGTFSMSQSVATTNPSSNSTLSRRETFKKSNNIEVASTQRLMMEHVDPLESTESMVNAFASVALIEAETEPNINRQQVYPNLQETWVDGLDRIGSKGVSIRSISQSNMRNSNTLRLRSPLLRSRVQSAGQLQRINEHDSGASTPIVHFSTNSSSRALTSNDHVGPAESYVIEVPPHQARQQSACNNRPSLINSTIHESTAQLVVHKMSSEPSLQKKLAAMNVGSSSEIEYAEIVGKQQKAQLHQSSTTNLASSGHCGPASSCGSSFDSAFGKTNTIGRANGRCNLNVKPSATDKPNNASHTVWLTQSCGFPSDRAAFKSSVDANTNNALRTLDESIEDDLITKSYHGGYCSRQTSEILNGVSMKKKGQLGSTLGTCGVTGSASHRGFLHRFGVTLTRAFTRAFHHNEPNVNSTPTTSSTSNTSLSPSSPSSSSSSFASSCSSYKPNESTELRESVESCDVESSTHRMNRSDSIDRSNANRSSVAQFASPVEINLRDFCIINRPSVAASAKRLADRSTSGSIVGARAKQSRACSLKRAGQNAAKSGSTAIGCACRRCANAQHVLSGLKKRNSMCKKSQSGGQFVTADIAALPTSNSNASNKTKDVVRTDSTLTNSDGVANMKRLDSKKTCPSNGTIHDSAVKVVDRVSKSTSTKAAASVNQR